MTSTVELGRVLSLHKSIVGAPNIHIRAGKGYMRLVSTQASGVILSTRIASASEFSSICVDQTVFAPLAKGKGDLQINTDGSKVVILGSRLKAELPGVVEVPPEIPKTENRDVIPADAKWLTEIIPFVALPALDQGGAFSAECSDGEWRISCTDVAHGACAFGKGKSTCKFSLLPSDALKVKSVLEAINGDAAFSIVDSTLVITSPNISASFPTIEGEAQPREEVENNSLKLGVVSANKFKEALKGAAPFLQDKEAPPLQLAFGEDRLIVKTSSSAGNFSQVVSVKNSKPAKISLSYKLLSHFLPVIPDDSNVGVFVVMEDQEACRITFKVGDVYYLMLTST